MQGEFRYMPHPQTYRDGAVLSRLKCTQSCVGISTYVENAIHLIQHHTLNDYITPSKEGAYKSPNARSSAPSSALKRCVQMPTEKRCKRTLCSLCRRHRLVYSVETASAAAR